MSGVRTVLRIEVPAAGSSGPPARARAAEEVELAPATHAVLIHLKDSEGELRSKCVLLTDVIWQFV